MNISDTPPLRRGDGRDPGRRDGRFVNRSGDSPAAR